MMARLRSILKILELRCLTKLRASKAFYTNKAVYSVTLFGNLYQNRAGISVSTGMEYNLVSRGLGSREVRTFSIPHCAHNDCVANTAACTLIGETLSSGREWPGREFDLIYCRGQDWCSLDFTSPRPRVLMA
jgi:hypothetical protein